MSIVKNINFKCEATPVLEVSPSQFFEILDDLRFPYKSSQSVRDAITKLDLHLVLYREGLRGKGRGFSSMCERITVLLKEDAGTNGNILADQNIQDIRTEIGDWVHIKFKILSQNGLQKFIQFIKDSEGTISRGKIMSKADQELKSVWDAITNTINAFAKKYEAKGEREHAERKKLAREIIEKTLSEAAGGIAVTIDTYHRGKREPRVGEAEVGEKKNDEVDEGETQLSIQAQSMADLESLFSKEVFIPVSGLNISTIRALRMGPWRSISGVPSQGAVIKCRVGRIKASRKIVLISNERGATPWEPKTDLEVRQFNIRSSPPL